MNCRFSFQRGAIFHWILPPYLTSWGNIALSICYAMLAQEKKFWRQQFSHHCLHIVLYFLETKYFYTIYLQNFRLYKYLNAFMRWIQASSEFLVGPSRPRMCVWNFWNLEGFHKTVTQLTITNHQIWHFCPFMDTDFHEIFQWRNVTP